MNNLFSRPLSTVQNEIALRKGSLNKTMENLSFHQEKLWFSVVVYFSKEKANLEQDTDSEMEDLPSEHKYSCGYIRWNKTT